MGKAAHTAQMTAGLAVPFIWQLGVKICFGKEILPGVVAAYLTAFNFCRLVSKEYRSLLRKERKWAREELPRLAKQQEA